MEIYSPLPFWTKRILERTDTAESPRKSLEPFLVHREPVHRPSLERAFFAEPGILGKAHVAFHFGALHMIEIAKRVIEHTSGREVLFWYSVLNEPES